MTLIAADLAATGISQVAVADRLLPAARGLVEQYAPDAPEAIQNEAVIRCAGWLAEQPMAARMSGTVGDIAASYATGALSAMHHSGAKALLSPWKVHRGGAV